MAIKKKKVIRKGADRRKRSAVPLKPAKKKAGIKGALKPRRENARSKKSRPLSGKASQRTRISVSRSASKKRSDAAKKSAATRAANKLAAEKLFQKRSRAAKKAAKVRKLKRERATPTGKLKPVKIVKQKKPRKIKRPAPRVRGESVDYTESVSEISGRESHSWEIRFPHEYGELGAGDFVTMMIELLDHARESAAFRGLDTLPLAWSGGAYVCVSRKPRGGRWSDWECETGISTPFYAVFDKARKQIPGFIAGVARGSRDGAHGGGEYRFWIRGLFVIAEHRPPRKKKK